MKIVQDLEKTLHISSRDRRLVEPSVLPGRTVEVSHTDGHLAVFSLREFDAGDVILAIRGYTIESPSRYSIQVGLASHVAPGDVPDGLAYFDDYLWPFLNHSFEPNAKVHDRTVAAICDIQAGDEVHFNYNSTEWEIAEPFHCVRTGRLVRGYRYLSAEERAAIRDITAPFLLDAEM